MQPSDQEELRRRAQEAMKRRIDTTARREEAPTPPQPAQQPPQRPQQRRQRVPDAPRRIDTQDRRRPQQPQVEAEPLPQRVEIPEHTIETMTSAEQRDAARPPVERDIRERVDQMVEQERREVLPRNAYAASTQEADLQVQRLRINRDLRDRDAVRRAFVMMEILGKPVALRDQNEQSFPGAG